MTDFKIAYYPDGSFRLVEFPEQVMDDGREVVTITANFRIEGGRKCFINVPVTRRTLRENVRELQAELKRQAEWLSRHPDKLSEAGDPVTVYP